MGSEEKRLAKELQALKKQRTKKEGIVELKRKIGSEKRAIRRAKYGGLVSAGKIAGKVGGFVGKAGLGILDEATKPTKSSKKKGNKIDFGF